ncbi:DUF6119 family protein [Curtobacterium flaccumfaciens]|uniref:DUF6119 family protein n=1 Tax=Curtobacterium flaccumfaciens TaxID=2035 RepID=UPI001BDDD65A|nr:DUF6119 family protein [Curtobacterium flaccumfaciens]MBT1606148.1 TIGR04141 family sporadically distributed protein [Curtobacterium flaccumfaciens pv. betae]MBT1658094.1 TIGR04141 family sporadically distributed protein [Curtobacterium flaccumfaciens pv. betae]MCS0470121.1 TIGR04141 family sporadically distributed protein [Curtobacterium flaccumfaciens pv. betae]MCS0475379.1 TIGR04141 family sporadically distributed protein [Curtobacterium flaccumfaciens pv. betae]MCS0476969.1 TIGR04141 fa
MSIYLLKPGHSSENSLNEKHGLALVSNADAIPPKSELWTAGVHTSTPWWQGYFGLPDPQKSANLGAILFLPCAGRTFALTFGQTAAQLRDDSYEYDFGLKVSLNAVDPDKLKSTDTSEPGAGRRQRTQTGADSAITFFDFDSDSSVMKSITGKAKTEYEHLVRHVTGATNLRIGTSVRSEGLVGLCMKLLELYESTDYRASFPDIENLQPVRDPGLISLLDEGIDLFKENPAPFLMLPEVTEYNEEAYFRYSGVGSNDLHGELNISDLTTHLVAGEVKTLGPEDLRRIRVMVTDGNGSVRKSYALYRCLNVENTSTNGSVYILHDGSWYAARQTFVDEMRAAIRTAIRVSSLPAFNDARESEYNSRVADGLSTINLDMTNIAGPGRTALEPADLLRIENGSVNLYHVKVSTRSSDLSHLFNQGLNSAQLLLSEESAAGRLQAAAADRSEPPIVDISSFLETPNIVVRYVVVSRQEPSEGEIQLPFFSQITFWRVLRAFKMLRITATLELVKNDRPRKPSKPKERKERSDKGKKRT